MEKEIWRPVVGYEGLYEVSNLGRLRSLDRVVKGKDGRFRNVKGKMISLRSLNQGYTHAVLMKNGEPKDVKIHRLVALAFIPNPENKPHIDHIDTDRKNNKVSNLRWATRKENANNPLTVEKYRKSSSKEGSGWKIIEARNKPGCRVSERPVCQYTLDGCFIRRYRSVAEASQSTGILPYAIRAARDGDYRQAGGFLWANEGNPPVIKTDVAKGKKRPVFQYREDGTFVAGWPTIRSAERELGANHIGDAACSGKLLNDSYWSFEHKSNLFYE